MFLHSLHCVVETGYGDLLFQQTYISPPPSLFASLCVGCVSPLYACRSVPALAATRELASWSQEPSASPEPAAILPHASFTHTGLSAVPAAAHVILLSTALERRRTVQLTPAGGMEPLAVVEITIVLMGHVKHSIPSVSSILVSQRQWIDSGNSCTLDLHHFYF